MLSLLLWAIIIVGALAIAWVVLRGIPMPEPMRVVVNVIYGVVALILLLWFASAVLGPPPHLGR